MEKFKTEPKYPAVKESPLNEVALIRACLKDWFSFVNQKKCGKPETGGRRWAKTRLKPSSNPGPVHIHTKGLIFSPFIVDFCELKNVTKECESREGSKNNSRPSLGTIPILRQLIFGLFKPHPPYQHKYSTERQQNCPIF